MKLSTNESGEPDFYSTREKKGWKVAESLLLDGDHENPEIRLEKVIFWPDNIVQLFQRFKVKKTFDLLSVDTDSYEFFMLEAILEAGYQPRVIIVEYNANFEMLEARSILPPGRGQHWARWDFSTYHVSYSRQPVSQIFSLTAGDVPAGHPVPVQQVLLLRGLL